MRDERGETAPPFGGPGEDRRHKRNVGRTGGNRRKTRGDSIEHGGIDVAEIVTPVNEPWHGRAAGVEHEADTRGTEVEKRDTYSLTGIEAALRAAIVAS